MTRFVILSDVHGNATALEAVRKALRGEKPDFVANWINGGYFFFHRDFLEYLSPKESCVLERDPLIRLARDGQLSIYRHGGFWACMDTLRDHEYLNKLWASGQAPWAV